MTYRVIATIQSGLLPEGGSVLPDPHDVTYYNGDDLARAIAALASAVTTYDGKYTDLLAARIEIGL